MADDKAISLTDSRAGAAKNDDREAHIEQAIEQVLALGAEVNRSEGRATFSLLELMLIVTLLGVLLGLIRTLGLWGAMISFVGAFAWTRWIHPHLQPDNLPRQETVFDCVWGLIMPIVCLVVDPFVFKDQPELVDRAFDWRSIAHLTPQLHEDSVIIYAFIAWQMTVLLVWILARRWLSYVAGLFFGTWLVGALFAGVLGIILAPTRRSIVGIGLLGFTPLFTTYALGRRLREAIDDGVLDASDQSVPIFWLLTAFGFIGAWLVPLFATSWLDPLIPK